jgi:hypothetical protein
MKVIVSFIIFSVFFITSYPSFILINNAYAYEKETYDSNTKKNFDKKKIIKKKIEKKNAIPTELRSEYRHLESHIQIDNSLTSNPSNMILEDEYVTAGIVFKVSCKS